MTVRFRALVAFGKIQNHNKSVCVRARIQVCVFVCVYMRVCVCGLSKGINIKSWEGNGGENSSFVHSILVQDNSDGCT